MAGRTFFLPLALCRNFCWLFFSEGPILSLRQRNTRAQALITRVCSQVLQYSRQTGHLPLNGVTSFGLGGLTLKTSVWEGMSSSMASFLSSSTAASVLFAAGISFSKACLSASFSATTASSSTSSLKGFKSGFLALSMDSFDRSAQGLISEESFTSALCAVGEVVRCTACVTAAVGGAVGVGFAWAMLSLEIPPSVSSLFLGMEVLVFKYLSQQEEFL